MKRDHAKAVIGRVLVPVLFLFTAAGLAQLAEHRLAKVLRAKPTALANSPVLLGYWHNFVNGAGFVRLADVSSQFDLVDIAFGMPVSGSTSTIGFAVDSAESEAQFTADVATLHSRGKVVLLSIGGENGVVQLNTTSDVQNFTGSVTSIINKFGLDGIDIDFEGSSLTLNPNDTDFKNPTTPGVVNLISALRQLRNAFGPGFIISMAPETFFVQAGFKSYSGQSGVYLPVIFGIRDILTYIHVQDYNSGTMYGLDGQIYAEGTADFHVAMTEMLLQGFPVAGDSNSVFPPLQPGQVAFGVPANASAADRGFTTNADLVKALTYLIKGTSFGGQYVLRNPAGYQGLRGLMTWSINWDAAGGFSLSSSVGGFLHGLAAGVGHGPVISAAIAVEKSLVVSGSGFDNGAVIVVNGRDQRTVNDDASPTTTLTGIKTIKRAMIRRGETARVQVRNSSGALSNVFQYSRPN
jgi:chitinase